jgi:cellulose synthase/poly-beta-1,6-N-acetylglucosamine synthase-like glycosyltransferase
MRAVFWASLLVVAYTYAGYPLLVWLAARLFGRAPASEDVTPPVSLLIPAYNEERYLEEKLRNSTRLDYPPDRLEIVVASDGSTDRTNAIAESFRARGVRLVVHPHMGKSRLLTRTVPQLRGAVLVFSDASIELAPDALRKLVRHFADPRVGCVSGSYRLKASVDLRSEGEGGYWRYESFIKRQQSRLHSVLGAHGPLYAIRAPLFTPLADHEINDDYLIPMRVVAQGYRAIYDPEVLTYDWDLVSMEGEFARRRRIASGNCQQIVELRHMLHPRFGWTAWSLLSHKVLRMLAPLFLVLLLPASLALPWPWGAGFAALQALFYLAAAAGYVSQRMGAHNRWLAAPFYFCMGNAALAAGLFRYCFSRNRYSWERAR